MRVRWTKLSDERHRLELVRDDGTKDGAELDTRTTLTHDLIHFAVEREAGLQESFYGLLSQGVTLASLNDRSMMTRPTGEPPESELDRTEMIVGPMTSVVRGKATPAELLAGFDNLLGAYGMERPPWLDHAFI